MKYFKLKTLCLGLVLLALGMLSGKIEQTYYQYIDADGVLRESWFFPLAIIFLLLGTVSHDLQGDVRGRRLSGPDLQSD